MAKLSGDVDILGLPSLLEGIIQNQGQGTLTLSQGADRKVFHLSPAGIRILQTTRRRTNTLGDILVRTRRLSRAQITPLLDLQKVAGRPLGELLVEQGMLTRAEIESVLKTQVEEEIYEVFLWSSPVFSYEDGPAPPASPESPIAGILVDTGIPSLMLEAARRCDEYQVIRKTIPDEGRVLSRTDKPFQPEGIDLDVELAAEILAGVDGRRTVREIVDASSQNPFNVLRQLYLLTTEEYLRVSGLRPERTTQTMRRPATPPAPDAVTAAVQGRALLVISDMPTFRKALCTFLTASGLHPVEAVSRGDFREILARTAVSGILLDVSVASQESLRLCERLRGFTAAPVLMISPNPTKEAVLQAIRSGAREYLVKPFKNSILLERIAMLVGPPVGEGEVVKTTE